MIAIQWNPNKAAQAIRRDLVSSLLRPGGLDGGEKNWSLGWSPVGMGSVWIAGALGHNLSAWYSTGFRWFDSPDISGRMGGIAFVVRGDFLPSGDSNWSDFKDEWA